MMIRIPEPIFDLFMHLHAAGGQGWLVGGCVRDHLLGLSPKDLDIEVHHLSAADLQAVLRTHGSVKAVGRSFGVFKLRLGQDELDISLPQPGRSRTPQGEPVVLAGDPHLGITEALRRRDLTINAIAYDPLTQRYADPFHGRDDIQQGILRAVDPETFGDDPLRVLRVMQFAGRMGFGVDPDLAALGRSLPIADLPAERLLTEFQKLLLKSPQPSVGLTAARAVNIFPRLFPALAREDGPELAQALDRAARIRRQQVPPLALMLAVLLHRCAPPDAEAVLDRLKIYTQNRYPLRSRVLFAVTAWHELADGTVTDRRLRWLAEDGELALTARVAMAATGAPHAEAVLHRAMAMGLAHRPLAALLKGRDLSALGIPAGPWMGDILRQVRAEQLDGTILDKEQATGRAMRLWKEHQRSGGGG